MPSVIGFSTAPPIWIVQGRVFMAEAEAAGSVFPMPNS